MRTTFTQEEVVLLQKNPSVFSCTDRSINYTFEFKTSALRLHGEGVPARDIWKRAGFDTNLWKSHHFRNTLRDWRRIVKERGKNGLWKQGGVQYDRGPDGAPKDKLKRLELEVKYLKAENAFLTKRRAELGLSDLNPKRSTD